MSVNGEGGKGWSRLGCGVGGGPLFMDLFYLFAAIYQLGHCPVFCSSCNIDFIYIYIYLILFHFILFYFILLPKRILYFYVIKYNIIYNINMQYKYNIIYNINMQRTIKKLKKDYHD